MHSSKVGNYPVSFYNRKEFRSVKNEIFKDLIYDVEIEPESILDIGSHIGLSILWWVSNFPNAQIIGLEPNPDLFEYLDSNVGYLSNVHLIEKALVPSPDQDSLYIPLDSTEWSSNGSMKKKGWNGELKLKPIKVDVITVKELVNADIDLIKLDVEGLEVDLVAQILNHSSPKYIIVESHGNDAEILRISKSKGYKIVRQIKDGALNVLHLTH